ncbi:MAG: MFS transporter [Isosphaeraceae bacterium]
MIPLVHGVSAAEKSTDPGPSHAPAWAWGLCWLMFASTVLNYMDRQTIALVKPKILDQFAINNEAFGWVLAAFQLTYAFFQVPAGFLTDRWDPRRTYAGAVAWWSLAGAIAAFSPSLGFLMACRALLGVGESFNWPCALKVTGRVLPPAARGLGNGIFNSGAAVGAILTPLIVPPLAGAFGWRVTFLAIGLLGAVWIIAWLLLTRGPAAGALAADPAPERAEGPGPSPMAIGSLAALVVASLLLASTAWRFGAPALWWAVAFLMVGLLIVARILPEQAGIGWLTDLGHVVRRRRFWVLAIVSSSINVCWHFLVNWLPGYLQDDRKWEFVVGGMLSALPFIAADLGNIGGGALSLGLGRGPMGPTRARLLVMTGCTALIASGAAVGFVRNDALVMLLLALMALGTAAFMANYFALCQDVSPRHTGLVVGILGGLGNLFAAGFSPVVGRIKDEVGTYAPAFQVVGLLPFLGLAALWLAWGREPVADGD